MWAPRAVDPDCSNLARCLRGFWRPRGCWLGSGPWELGVTWGDMTLGPGQVFGHWPWVAVGTRTSFPGGVAAWVCRVQAEGCSLMRGIPPPLGVYERLMARSATPLPLCCTRPSWTMLVAGQQGLGSCAFCP